MPLLELQLPDGRTASLDAAPGDASTLADYLEAHGFSLNTRCGGRGLCKGCQIRARTAGDARTLRACQTPLSSLPEGTVTLEIPAASWHDQTLCGVSCFDLRASLPAARMSRPVLALAIDLGTTTLAAALWDLSDGQCLAHASIANPQRRYGDNVLSRISYSIDRRDGTQKLQRSLIDEGLHPLIARLARQAGCPAESITEATLAGNPVMLHTLMGCSLEGFGTFPFKPEFLDARQLDASEIGLHPAMRLRLMPSLGAFVGADITAGALASGLLARHRSGLLIDFGTNGEILLQHEGRSYATATAAGPAFEGGRLSCGASAGGDVISSLERSAGVWRAHLCQPGERPATGISGAAYVDFLALGFDCALLNAFGRFDRAHPDVSMHTVDGATEPVVRLGSRLWISEPDVAEILQAKAAIGAGVRVLLERAGIEASALDTVFVAGGFGYHLNPAHAIDIGLLPPVALDRIDIIGNASLGGASLALQSDCSPSIQALLDHCEIIELNQIESFEDHFIDCLSLEKIG